MMSAMAPGNEYRPDLCGLMGNKAMEYPSNNVAIGNCVS